MPSLESGVWSLEPGLVSTRTHWLKKSFLFPPVGLKGPDFTGHICSFFSHGTKACKGKTRTRSQSRAPPSLRPEGRHPATRVASWVHSPLGDGCCRVFFFFFFFSVAFPNPPAKKLPSPPFAEMNMVYFPLLVLKGMHHYWKILETCFFFFSFLGP